MGQGSATSLKGLAYTLSLFVDHGITAWTSVEKRSFLNAGRAAERWLVEQALRYGVELQFHNGGNYGLQSPLHLRTLPPVEADGMMEPSELLGRALRTVGWDDPAQLHDAILRQSGARTLHTVIYVNEPGRSFAGPCGSSRASKRFLESCVVFKRSSVGRAEEPSTIAHEILHLYGAWDMYASAKFSPTQLALAKRRFPNDIMVDSHGGLMMADVGPLTAWRVGWAAKEAWFDTLRPKGQ